jgi:hypothetical protein
VFRVQKFRVNDISIGFSGHTGLNFSLNIWLLKPKYDWKLKICKLTDHYILNSTSIIENYGIQVPK